MKRRWVHYVALVAVAERQLARGAISHDQFQATKNDLRLQYRNGLI